jgi:hypothetical protein
LGPPIHPLPPLHRLTQSNNNTTLLQELLVPKALHGSVINDGWFSRGAAWSPAEDVVVYVAEAPPPEQTPLFGSSRGNGGSSNGNGSKAATAAAAPRTWRGVAGASEDWGELNTGKQPPALFALHTPSWTVHRVSPSSSPSSSSSSSSQGSDQQALGEASWGQPAWSPDGKVRVLKHRALAQD